MLVQNDNVDEAEPGPILATPFTSSPDPLAFNVFWGDEVGEVAVATATA
jgi:hypothetical protein